MTPRTCAYVEHAYAPLAGRPDVGCDVGSVARMHSDVARILENWPAIDLANDVASRYVNYVNVAVCARRAQHVTWRKGSQSSWASRDKDRESNEVEIKIDRFV